MLFEPGNSSVTTTRAVAVAVLSKVRKLVSSTAFRSFPQARQQQRALVRQVADAIAERINECRHLVKNSVHLL